jgi:hypothetical protein
MPCFSVVYGAQHYFGQDDGTSTAVRVAVSSDIHVDKRTATVTVKLITYLFAVDEV